MSNSRQLHPDRLFPAEPGVRAIARELYNTVHALPIISPHGHTDARWFAENAPFSNATELLLQPDHYVLRMLYSQGLTLEQLGIGRIDEAAVEADSRTVWRLFAEHYHLFRGTPSALWLDHVFGEIFGINAALCADTADMYFDTIGAALSSEAFRPRALFERFNIDCLATTESPLDSLRDHESIRDSEWQGRVITTFRPDPVIDPEYEGFPDNILRLGELTGEDTMHWEGYLSALRKRRADFRACGATATDHGHPDALTANLPTDDCRRLFQTIVSGAGDTTSDRLFRAQMLTEMARMSLEDGMVMQLHPGSYRNHNAQLFRDFGRDKGADIPVSTEYVHALKPLLDAVGNEPGFRLILFTLDESTYSRELAPLAGHYPCLLLGPPWWFHDSPEGMRRYREQITETAGYYNTAGFNDDTRAFLSIPARHDVARRMDCGHLAQRVADHRLHMNEAVELAAELANGLARKAYRL